MSLKDKPYFCVLPWMHLHVETEGTVIPCCMAKKFSKEDNFVNAKDTSINEALNNKDFKRIRKDMLADKKIKNCEKCYILEKYGNHSARKHSNTKYLTAELEQKIISNTQSDGYYDVDILYFDVRFSNVCNYKCRMCGAGASTKWYEDTINPPLDTLTSIPDIVKYCDDNYEYLKNIKYVYFAGGEPLVQKEHYEFLDWCIKNDLHPELYYQSNGSIIKYGKYNIIDMWKNFSRVTYSVSLDGLGSLGEYIRSGYNDVKVKNNLNKIVEHFGSNKEVVVNSTWMIYNAFYITEFFDEIDIEPWVMTSNVYPQLLVYPEYLQPKVLPQKLKKQAIKKILNSKWYEKYPEKFEALLNNLKEKGSPDLWNKFVERTKWLDDRRNESLTDIFPEIRKYL